MNKLLILAILLAFLSFSFVFAFENNSRYFIKSKSVFWQKSFGARNVFDNGFSADLNSFQIRLAKIFGLDIEPVDKFYILPPISQIEVGDNESGKVKEGKLIKFLGE